MNSVKGLARQELAALIAETLREKGIDVVLSGGSCVSIYSSEQYVSKDLDFIDVSLKSNRAIGKALAEIGFVNEPKNSRHFVHPETELTVEFPSAPLMVGDEHIPLRAAAEIETTTGVLRLLSPTDCIKDRLANYYYFGDSQCLQQALLVAKSHPVNLISLEAWHRTEGQEQGYKTFVGML
jgi:hypothetical protein